MSEDVLLGPSGEVDYTPDPSEEVGYEPTDEERLEELNREQEKVIHKQARLYYLVFTSPDGAAVFEDMRIAYMNRVSVDEENPDPYLTAFNEGQRSVVLQIMALMEIGQTEPE